MQGDILAIVDASGSVVAKYDYDAWGYILAVKDANGNDVSDNTTHIANVNPFRYRGYYYDTETGLYYLNSRYYDPETGRFINADSLKYLGKNGDFVNYNLFAYCANNPINQSDKTGQLPEWINTAFKVVAVVAIVVTTALVVTGTGGAAAVVALGVACSGATGGYFNEQAGGNFASGYIGGSVSGLIQGMAGYLSGPFGVMFGGSVGSGFGTFLTGVLDNAWGTPEQEKTMTQIAKDSMTSSAVALCTSSVSAYVSCASQMASKATETIFEPYTETFCKMIDAFFCGIDDALTYVFLMD